MQVKEIPGEWQAHHLIPVELIQDNQTVREAIKEGFDFNGSVNGISLPKFIHIGSHPEYTELINNYINEYRIKFPNESAKHILEAAAQRAEIYLKTMSINLNK